MLVCCVGLTGSEFVLPTTAWDLTYEAKLIHVLVVITWLNLKKKYQIPKWTIPATTQAECGDTPQLNQLTARLCSRSAWVLQATNLLVTFPP